MNRELAKKDFWDYVDGKAGDFKNQIALLLASDPQVRKKISELKRDFFLIDSQIPTIEMSKELSYEIAGTCHKWLNLHYKKSLPITSLLKSKKTLSIAAFLIFLLGLIAWNFRH